MYMVVNFGKKILTLNLTYVIIKNITKVRFLKANKRREPDSKRISWFLYSFEKRKHGKLSTFT